jgi:hypothetical protein
MFDSISFRKGFGMITRLATVSVALVLLASQNVSANPISCEKLVVQQVPETQHVQITWANYCGDSDELDRIQRDGQEMNPTWVPLADFSTNLGSGLTIVSSIQTCDCDVELGSHYYVIDAKEFDNYSITVNKSIKVVENLKPPEEPDVEEIDETKDAGFEAPWDIPDPVSIQGLDCVTACSESSGEETSPEDAGENQQDSGSPSEDSSVLDPEAYDAAIVEQGPDNDTPVDGDPNAVSEENDVSVLENGPDSSTPSESSISTSPEVTNASISESNDGHSTTSGSGCSIAGKGGSNSIVFLIGVAFLIGIRRKRIL